MWVCILGTKVFKRRNKRNFLKEKQVFCVFCWLGENLAILFLDRHILADLRLHLPLEANSTRTRVTLAGVNRGGLSGNSPEFSTRERRQVLLKGSVERSAQTVPRQVSKLTVSGGEGRPAMHKSLAPNTLRSPLHSPALGEMGETGQLGKAVRSTSQDSLQPVPGSDATQSSLTPGGGEIPGARERSPGKKSCSSLTTF